MGSLAPDGAGAVGSQPRFTDAGPGGAAAGGGGCLLYQQSTSEPWCDQAPYLLQLSDVGAITAMTLLAAIGDIHRFEHPNQLVGYAGLGGAHP